MQRKRTLSALYIWLTHTFILSIACLVAGNIAEAQITRDVGEIAVIEGDNNIIFTPTDQNGNPCPQVSVNMQQLARRFYQTHVDQFHVLIMFTNFNHLLSPGANCNATTAAFYQPVSNAIQGINVDIFDNSEDYGSSERLNGVINMNNVTTYPANPNQRIPGNNDSLLSLLGQEVGHRWGAYVQFDADLNPDRINPSGALIGRQNAHWSFFFHTASVTGSATTPEASALEGNFWLINQPAPGQFQTATITDGFSPLDLYLMGLLPRDQVGPLWFIANPINVNPPANAASAPNAGTQAQGNQTFVTMQNIVDVVGGYSADYPNTFGIFSHAFILLTQQGIDVTQAQLSLIDSYRVAWENYFAQRTQNRGAVITNLSNVLFVDGAYQGFQSGTLIHPFSTVQQGRDFSELGGTLVITTGSYPENLTFTESLTVRAVRGTVTIGVRAR